MRVQFLWRFSWDTPKTPQQPKSGGEWVWGVYVSHAINFAPAPGGGALVPYKHHKAPVRQTNSRKQKQTKRASCSACFSNPTSHQPPVPGPQGPISIPGGSV